jgi:CheY-specific phosphatase CheX
MDSVLARTRMVLAEEADVILEEAESFRCDANELHLQDMTAIAGLGGPISLLIAFSFELRLLDAIFEQITQGITVTEDERPLLIRDTAAEMVNTILGRCTADIQIINQSITLSPPVIVEDARCIHRPKNAVFASMRVRTDKGYVSVGILAPREMFDDQLNFQA